MVVDTIDSDESVHSVIPTRSSSGSSSPKRLKLRRQTAAPMAAAAQSHDADVTAQ